MLAGFHNVRSSFIFIQFHPTLPKKFSGEKKRNSKKQRIFISVHSIYFGNITILEWILLNY